jgi:hypothetical protein
MWPVSRLRSGPPSVYSPIQRGGYARIAEWRRRSLPWSAAPRSEAIAAALEALRARPGEIVAIEGEPGIGKSRLLAHLEAGFWTGRPSPAIRSRSGWPPRWRSSPRWRGWRRSTSCWRAPWHGRPARRDCSPSATRWCATRCTRRRRAGGVWTRTPVPPGRSSGAAPGRSSVPTKSSRPPVRGRGGH